MRLTANAKKRPKQIIVQPVPLPSPVGGWDAISPLANMPVDRAVQLDNWFCRPGWIEPRLGYVPQGLGLHSSTTPVQTVMSYNELTGNRKLFGVAGGTIYDCSNQGQIATATTVTSLQSSRLQYTIFANPAVAPYLVTVNGLDNPWTYNGTSWSQPSIVIGYATGSITWYVNPIVGETINLNGTIVTFVTSGATGNQVNIGANLAATLANLLTVLQASSNPNIVLFTYSVALGTTLFITAVEQGVPGNSLTIAAGYATGAITFSINPKSGDTITLDGTALEFVAGNATGTIVFTTNPSNLATITLNGTIVTFVSGSPSGNQVQIGSTLAATMTALLTFLNAASDSNLILFTYSVIANSILDLTAASPGPAGASLTIAASVATPSGTTLTYGTGSIGTNQVYISSTLAQTLASLLSFLTGAALSSTAGSIGQFTYAISGDVLELTAVTDGLLGNALLISASAASASGSTLVGGSSAAASGTTLLGGGFNYGITPDQFVSVTSYMNRLWFVPVNSTNVVYLQTVGGVSGSASVFPLGQLMKKGGYIMAIGTWTVDTRQNVDEYIAFITSRGEILVYQGTDPTTAGTFALTGMYQVGAPIGRRCFLRITGDLQIITVDGLIGMSEMLSTDRAAANRVSLTSIIMNEMALAAQSYKNNFGWQVIEYPLGTMVIMNIPIQENQQQMQFVMNTITGAWSRFIGIDPTGTENPIYGINANCWEVDAFDNIYFGGNDGTVYQWNVGEGDNGKVITSVVQTAYNNFGNGAQLKRYPMLQPLITTSGNPIPSISINVDFNNSPVLSTSQPISAPVPLWDQINWNQFNWPGGPATTDSWNSVQGVGHYVSIYLQVSSVPNVNNPTFASVTQLNGFNIVAETGAFV